MVRPLGGAGMTFNEALVLALLVWVGVVVWLSLQERR